MTSHTRNAFIYATVVAMGGFLFGLDAALIAGTVDFITQEFSLTSIQLGTAVSAPALGVLVALPFAGYISNRFGRKKAILLVAVLYLVSAVTSAFAPSYATLVAARFLGGLAFSSISLASMYIGEKSEVLSRRRFVDGRGFRRGSARFGQPAGRRLRALGQSMDRTTEHGETPAIVVGRPKAGVASH